MPAASFTTSEEQSVSESGRAKAVAKCGETAAECGEAVLTMACPLRLSGGLRLYGQFAPLPSGLFTMEVGLDGPPYFGNEGGLDGGPC